MGAGGVAAGGALVPAGGAFAKGGHSSIDAFGTVAVTTEALTVTLLTEVLRRVHVNSVPAGVESEHRVLAETLVGATPPNNVGFEAFSIQLAQGIETALEGAGVGFGTQGSAPGAFHKLPHPIMRPPLKINSNKPT